MRNYWCYRIDNKNIKFFMNELNQNRLRQGWGWDIEQNLRNLKKDEGAKRNLPMFNRVKKNDILLVPHLPNYGEISIVEATEDWNKGYIFEIDKNFGDYGHIFPAKYIKKFTRNNENVTGNIRATLKNPSRFWKITHFSSDVEQLLNVEETELSKKQDYESRLESAIGTVFNEIFKESLFQDNLYNTLIKQFKREEWEYALVHGLRMLFPFYQVERVGGKEENKHGTDILIKIPGILPDYQYAIAIQVKDYEGFIAESEIINQINKADTYWNNNGNLKLVEKIVIITKADKKINSKLLNNTSSIKFIFATELKQLLSEIGKIFLGMK